MPTIDASVFSGNTLRAMVKDLGATTQSTREDNITVIKTYESDGLNRAVEISKELVIKHREEMQKTASISKAKPVAKRSTRKRMSPSGAEPGSKRLRTLTQKAMEGAKQVRRRVSSIASRPKRTSAKSETSPAKNSAAFDGVMMPQKRGRPSKAAQEVKIDEEDVEMEDAVDETEEKEGSSNKENEDVVENEEHRDESALPNGTVEVSGGDDAEGSPDPENVADSAQEV